MEYPSYFYEACWHCASLPLLVTPEQPETLRELVYSMICIVKIPLIVSLLQDGK
jgi:hypothetical protein